MTDPNILDRIDETLDDYDHWDGHSPDAARWDGDDWIDERRPEGWHVGDLGTSDPPLCHGQEAAGHRDISFSGEQRLWMVEPENPDAPTMAELDNATELTPYLQAVDEASVLMLRAAGLDPTEWQRVVLNSWLLPSVPLTYFPPQRPRSAAERTRSPRWRAGSRRTKRHARRRR